MIEARVYSQETTTRAMASNMLGSPLQSLDKQAAKGGSPFRFDRFTPWPIVSCNTSNGSKASPGMAAAASKISAAMRGKLQRKAELKATKANQKSLTSLNSLNSLQPGSVPPTDTEAAAEGAVTIAAALRHGSLAMPMMQQLAVLKHMDLAEEAAALQAELKEMVPNCHNVADGEAGNSGKYEKAAETVE